jgi:predicted NBD/HSP70 family sugar kinase
MARKTKDRKRVTHASVNLPAVTVESTNLLIRDGEGFIGDRANSRAFLEMLDGVRARMCRTGDDPLGKKPSADLGRTKIGRLLVKGGTAASGSILTAVEEFAQTLAGIIRRYIEDPGWKKVERIAVGGGFRGSLVGELALGRCAALLRLDGLAIDLVPIENDPDQAGLIGTAYLWEPDMLEGHSSILAIDIGGSNIRAGILDLPDGKKGGRIKVHAMELWKHSEDEPSREETMNELVAMIRRLIKRADKDGLDLAPLIGIGCPGMIHSDGAILQGGHNLPGDWESESFRLPDRLRHAIPEIGGEKVAVLLHNDAVAQGLSEIPNMRDVERWGVLTIGTGLGNASFVNRRSADWDG